MPTEYYKDAQKLGQREFRAAVFQGEYPYPSVLDDIVPDDRINRGRDLGTAHIPMEFVVGTRTSGRTKAFARNFLPLMGENTEFARKWDKLCLSQMEEGIRDPIKVYEYMNRYYVQEGNKRVSVLKFCNAGTVYAHVIRVLPEQNGSKEVELYNELVEFNQTSKVNYLEFTKLGSCARLQQLMGKGPKESWSEEERREFSGIHYHFRKAYEANGGKKLTTTVGDALLAFIEVYGYQTLRGNGEDEIKKLLNKAWEEVTLQQEDITVELKLEPEERKPGLLTRMFAGGEKKVAFIHDGHSDYSGWTKQHEAGRKHVQRVFGDVIQTTSYFNAMDGDPSEVIERAIAEGNTILFTTSSRLQEASLRSAIAHPNVTILNCSQLTHHRYISTYHIRMYEAKFVLGAIAGALAEDSVIGYAAYSSDTVEDEQIRKIYTASQVAMINAFALGAQTVNPRAKIHLEWFGREGLQDAVKRLLDRGARLISAQDVVNQSAEDSGFGLLRIDTDGNWESLASPIWHWDTYYETLLRSILDKTYQAAYAESSRAQSYYWGMSNGVLEVRCSDKLPHSIHRLTDLMQRNATPFSGKFYTQDGREIDGDADMEQLLHMDWLAENVEGTIPKD